MNMFQRHKFNARYKRSQCCGKSENNIKINAFTCAFFFLYFEHLSRFEQIPSDFINPVLDRVSKKKILVSCLDN
jgi:hypothetical protein